MYPFRNRTRWIMQGRYAHLVRALDRRKRGVQDTTLEARIEAMRWWNRIRAVVIVLLAIGVASAFAAWIASKVPAFETALVAINRITTASALSSGLLTVVYLFLTRLMGQLEADILAILTVDHSEKS